MSLQTPTEGYASPFEACPRGSRPAGPDAAEHLADYTDCIVGALSNLPPELRAEFLTEWMAAGYDIVSTGVAPPPTIISLEPVTLDLWGIALVFNFGSNMANFAAMALLGIIACTLMYLYRRKPHGN